MDCDLLRGWILTSDASGILYGSIYMTSERSNVYSKQCVKSNPTSEMPHVFGGGEIRNTLTGMFCP